VYPGAGGTWGVQSLQALVDSGAGVTLIRLDAAPFFGLDRDELKGKMPLTIGGVTGGTHGYPARVDLRIGTSAHGTPLDLLDLPVYFIDGKLPFHNMAVLLGQADVLKRLVFAQLNQLPNPFFTLRLPKRRK